MKRFEISPDLILEFDSWCDSTPLIRLRKKLGSVIVIYEEDWSALVGLIRDDLPPELELPWSDD